MEEYAEDWRKLLSMAEQILRFAALAQDDYPCWIVACEEYPELWKERIGGAGDSVGRALRSLGQGSGHFEAQGKESCKRLSLNYDCVNTKISY